MPTVLPPSRPEAPPSAPVPSRRAALRRGVGRYVRARWGDLWGRSHAPPRDWKRLRLGMEAVIGMTPRADSNPPSPLGDAAVAVHPGDERYRHLIAAGKAKVVVVTTIAREMLGFVWAIARAVTTPSAAPSATAT